MVIFQSRGTVVAVSGRALLEIKDLRSETYERARVAAPGWDVRVLGYQERQYY
jgi:hypothetical protein